MPLPIRLIATDVDGTLLAKDGSLPPENRQAILDAQEQGIPVAIASGRFPENVYCLLKKYGLSCPIIGTNGARIVDDRLRPLAAHTMDPAAAMAAYALLAAAGADFFVFGTDFVCSSNPTLRHHSELSNGDQIQALGLSYLHGPEAARQCCQGSVQKFFVCENVPLSPLREALRRIPKIDLTQSNPHNIEIMPAGIHKGHGVQEFASLLHIPLSQVMTVGDQENDIPMLEAAGYGVAVENASPETKAAARYETASNDAHGFADAVYRWALNRDSIR